MYVTIKPVNTKYKVKRIFVYKFIVRIDPVVLVAFFSQSKTQYPAALVDTCKQLDYGQADLLDLKYQQNIL